ncbi:MAG: HAD-IIIC family phosphatase [Lachnospiraceae bacterium]|nr:HAD-IIIC family phosphatase [Lachnospiraceae bacterium]
MKELEYPFDGDYILKKARHLRKALLADGTARIEKRIAVLGGSTTHDIVRILELFLLQEGIAPVFYESEYNRYEEDALFPPEELLSFHPDLIYIHTTRHNLRQLPETGDDTRTVMEKEEAAFSSFVRIWEKLRETHACPVIQNNFEMPDFRLLGNRDAWDVHGSVRFIETLNARFAAYAAGRDGFYINDIHYLSARMGLDRWYSPAQWYLYKYALSMEAIPQLSYNLACIIKSVFGKNKKALVLDLDNTLWGGVVGDDGQEGIEIGEETATAEAYTAFQRYIRAHRDIGIVLNVASKNTEENAKAGLTHPDSVLQPSDFLYLEANWDPKSDNIAKIAQGMNILPEAIVFVDDNPAEREIVTENVKGVSAPPLTAPEDYIRVIDRAGYFEVTNLSEDDLKRAEMYRENRERQVLQERFTDYHAYLLSLQMKAEIAPFAPVYYERISQLTNKSNQYNLTTRRYTVEEIRAAAEDDRCITLYGRLQDKFGDNGVVALLIARTDSSPGACHVDLFLMSCRVLKRDMEVAMIDALIAACRERGIKTVYGEYFPTAKNKMVEDFYELRGFTKVSSEPDENTGRDKTVWRFDIPEDYRPKCDVIETMI